jgi:hypothetical protein
MFERRYTNTPLGKIDFQAFNLAMNKKTAFQIVLLILLVGGGIYYLATSFKPAKIQMVYTLHERRVYRRVPLNNQPRFDAAFGLDGAYKLTSLKVVVLGEWTTNKQAQPLWHLVSDSRSVPVRAIIYGQRIEGMRPALSGARAEMLVPNVYYRLFIEAGSREGECDFKLPALPQTTP